MKGGSTRVKGAEPRRFFVMPAFFRGGERPAGAVRGARGDEMLARAGVRAGGGGMDLTGTTEKVKGLSQASLLLFFEGEKSRGSVFSESASSYAEAERLPVTLAGDMEGVNGFPLRGELFARKPEVVHVSIWVTWCIEPHCWRPTILAILRRGELLDARGAQLAKRQSRHGHGGSHCDFLRSLLVL